MVYTNDAISKYYLNRLAMLCGTDINRDIHVHLLHNSRALVLVVKDDCIYGEIVKYSDNHVTIDADTRLVEINGNRHFLCYYDCHDKSVYGCIVEPKGSSISEPILLSDDGYHWNQILVNLSGDHSAIRDRILLLSTHSALSCILAQVITIENDSIQYSNVNLCNWMDKAKDMVHCVLSPYLVMLVYLAVDKKDSEKHTLLVSLLTLEENKVATVSESIEVHGAYVEDMYTRIISEDSVVLIYRSSGVGYSKIVRVNGKILTVS